MKHLIVFGLLLFISLESAAGEPSSRVSMDPVLLGRLHKADVGQGETLAGSCAACHEAGGMGPMLDGQLATYLFKQLQDYKDGHRQNPVMSGLAATLSEQDQINLAAYYAQKTPKAAPKGDVRTPILVSQGDSRRILPPCAACHGSDGNGQTLDIPALSGQSETYLLATLKAYQDGTRHNDLYGRMRSLVKEMTEQELTEVAHYYANRGR